MEVGREEKEEALASLSMCSLVLSGIIDETWAAGRLGTAEQTTAVGVGC